MSWIFNGTERNDEKMKREIFEIKSNEKIADCVYKAELFGDTSDIKRAGQFINIALSGFFLRRPISVCDFGENTVTIIYKTVGDGTKYLSTLKSGDKLDVLTGLGNGFNIGCGGERPLVIGGGVGVPPMYGLAKRLILENKKPVCVLGFNKESDVFYKKEFEELGAKIYIATIDGSIGEKGFVTDVIKNLDGYTYYYACGPLPMLKAVYDTAKTSGELSFEERMGCGFGACMGCSCKTKYGNKRICKDGPVLKKEEIIW